MREGRQAVAILYFSFTAYTVQGQGVGSELDRPGLCNLQSALHACCWCSPIHVRAVSIPSTLLGRPTVHQDHPFGKAHMPHTYFDAIADHYVIYDCGFGIYGLYID